MQLNPRLHGTPRTHRERTFLQQASVLPTIKGGSEACTWPRRRDQSQLDQDKDRKRRRALLSLPPPTLGRLLCESSGCHQEPSTD